MTAPTPADSGKRLADAGIVAFDTNALTSIAGQLSQSAAALESPKSQCDTITGYVQGGAKEFIGTYEPVPTPYDAVAESLTAVTTLIQGELDVVIEQLTQDSAGLTWLAEAHTDGEAESTTTVESIDAAKAGTYT
ncbi:hypothetical protein [Mycolicibacter minnesotensis]